MLRNVVAIGVRFHKLPSEVMEMSVRDYELLLAHFHLEQQEAERANAASKAQANLSKLRRR